MSLTQSTCSCTVGPNGHWKHPSTASFQQKRPNRPAEGRSSVLQRSNPSNLQTAEVSCVNAPRFTYSCRDCLNREQKIQVRNQVAVLHQVSDLSPGKSREQSCLYITCLKTTRVTLRLQSQKPKVAAYFGVCFCHLITQGAPMKSFLGQMVF